MIVTRTLEEMTAEWRLRMHLQPEVQSAVISSAYGLGVERIIHAAIDDWYYDLLDHGDKSLIPVSDISAKVLATVNDDASVSVTLPANCRRVIAVKMSGWMREAQLVDPSSPYARMQESEYIRGRAYHPVGVVDGRRLTLYSAVGNSPQLEYLECVLDPEEGIYRFDPAALPKQKCEL